MASAHFTWLHSLPETLGIPGTIAGESEKLIVGIGIGALLIALGGMAASRIHKTKTDEIADEVIVPHRNLSLFGFFDLAVEGFVKFHDSILGVENRHHVPFVAAVFFFVLFSNLLGLIPGFAAVTTTVWINVAIALVVFAYFNLMGIRAHGTGGYIKHFCGPVWWLAVLIFPLEIFSTLLRILTLNLRLYWNITADHIVLDTFTQLTKVLIPVLFYAFGTFVCFMQATVFAILTMVYILLATQHEEGH
jgi:F-type H+-transporting ATPase subunit a